MDRESNTVTLDAGRGCPKCDLHGCPVCEAASRASIPADAPEDWIRVEAITVTFERDGLSDFFFTDGAMDRAVERVRETLKAENPQATVTVRMNEYKDGGIRIEGIDATGERFDIRNSDNDADGGGSPAVGMVQLAIQRAFEADDDSSAGTVRDYNPDTDRIIEP